MTTSSPLALLFDLDGTLVHSLPDLTLALNRLLAEEGRRPVSEPEVARMVGDGARVLVERAFTATGAAAGEPDLDMLTGRFVSIYETAATGGTQPYPGVVSTLVKLAERGHPMAVCTNKPYRPTMVLLEALDLLRFFPVVIGGGSTAERKPHPQPVLAALAGLGASASRALMVGDGLNDVLAARGAGVACVCVSYGYPHGAVEEFDALAVIDRFTDLPAIIAKNF